MIRAHDWVHPIGPDSQTRVGIVVVARHGRVAIHRHPATVSQSQWHDQAGRSRETRGRAAHSREHLVVRAIQVAASGHGSLGGKGIGCRLTGADTKGILRETQANAGLDAVRQLVAIQLVERLARHGHLIELDEAHGPV